MTLSYFDPLSTPGRKEGTSIQSISGNGTTAATATPIVADTGWTVVIVDAETNNTAVILPSGMSIGDLIETSGSSSAQVFPPSGEGFGFATFTGSESVSPGGSSILLRKITSTQWGIVAQQG